MRDAGAALDPGLRVERVEAVRDEREPVALAEQADQPGRVPGQLDHPEAGDLVALGDRARDLDGASVPHRQKPRQQHATVEVEPVQVQ